MVLLLCITLQQLTATCNDKKYLSPFAHKFPYVSFVLLSFKTKNEYDFKKAFRNRGSSNVLGWLLVWLYLGSLVKGPPPYLCFRVINSTLRVFLKVDTKNIYETFRWNFIGEVRNSVDPVWSFRCIWESIHYLKKMSQMI